MTLASASERMRQMEVEMREKWKAAGSEEYSENDPPYSAVIEERIALIEKRKP